MPGPALGFEAMVAGDGTVIAILSGDFDVCNAAALADQLAEIAAYRPQRLVFEMAEVSFMDCASARLIVGVRRSLPEGTRPVISNSPLVVGRVLQIIGLDALCDLTGRT
jgi:anti-anti-sigma factor